MDMFRVHNDWKTALTQIDKKKPYLWQVITLVCLLPFWHLWTLPIFKFTYFRFFSPNFMIAEVVNDRDGHRVAPPVPVWSCRRYAGWWWRPPWQTSDTWSCICRARKHRPPCCPERRPRSGQVRTCEGQGKRRRKKKKDKYFWYLSYNHKAEMIRSEFRDLLPLNSLKFS